MTIKKRITPAKVTKLKENQVFVFGANKKGDHLEGAAKLAVEKFGAIMGQGAGLQGDSYAINTMSGLEILKQEVDYFIQSVASSSKTFLVTEIGCGIAGYKVEDVAPLFYKAKDIENIHLPASFWKFLETYNPIPVVRGYKVFNPDMTCKDFKYEVGKEYKYAGKIQICSAGFHFCQQADHCFSYYSFDSKNIVCEVEAWGETQTHAEDSKVVTNHIKIIRQLTWAEVLIVSNQGKENTGHSNSGDRNNGDRNSGDRNSGDSNSGNWNSGNWNSGYRNSGNWNSGDRNSGDSNSGYRNSGNWNSGDRNSGDSNSGDRNSGNWNSGDRNSGDSNSGYRNSGAFCINPDPILFLFDKPCKSMTVKQWEKSKALHIMEKIETTIWVPWTSMTKQERENNPKLEASEGFTKAIPMKEAWQNAWNNWTDDNKNEFTSLENFDADKFFEITGIKV